MCLLRLKYNCEACIYLEAEYFQSLDFLFDNKKKKVNSPPLRIQDPVANTALLEVETFRVVPVLCSTVITTTIKPILYLSLTLRIAPS